MAGPLKTKQNSSVDPAFWFGAGFPPDVGVSEPSRRNGISKLLSLYGIAIPGFLDNDLDFINPVLAQCETFFNDSTQQLVKAISDAGDARIAFVPSGFTDDNSAFVPNTSLLWGLNLNDDLDPQDPVAATRHPLCDAAHPDPLEVLDRELCYRASAGHPNVEGAVQFSKQVLAALI